jgi:paraquat-inducible protein B
VSEREKRLEERPEAPPDAPQVETPRARVHPVEWSPWLWILPALALLFVGWLVVRYGFFGGGDVTVRFVEARGLDRYSPVRYRGAKVGTVQRIRIDDDLEQVEVRISMDAEMSSALRTGTRFWIVEPGLGGGLGGLLGGTYVGISPGGGEPTRDFQGMEHPPILAAPEPGRIFILESDGIGSAAIGSAVEFQGMRVGRVLGADYDHRRALSAIHVFVLENYAEHVREGTRFWRTGGASLSLEGGRLSLGDASLASMMSPALAFYTPDVLAGPQAPEGTRFELFDSRNAAVAAAGGPHLAYLTYFPGPIKGLAPGTPVEMKGVEVGRVRDIRLRYVAATASLETPVTLVLDPRRLELAVDDGSTREEVRAARRGDRRPGAPGHAGAAGVEPHPARGRRRVARPGGDGGDGAARRLVRPADHPGGAHRRRHPGGARLAAARRGDDRGPAAAADRRRPA